MQMGSQASRGRLHRSESMFEAPKVSEAVIKKNQDEFKADSSMYLKERGILKYKIQSGQIEAAREYLLKNFADLYK